MNPIARNGKDFWAGIIYIVAGAGACIISRDYGMGSAGKMGPAYFPTILGALLTVIGIISILRSFLKSGSPTRCRCMERACADCCLDSPVRDDRARRRLDHCATSSSDRQRLRERPV